MVSTDILLPFLSLLCLKHSISQRFPFHSSSSDAPSLPSFPHPSAILTNSARSSQSVTHSSTQSPLTSTHSQSDDQSSCLENLVPRDQCGPYNVSERWMNKCYCSDISNKALYSEGPLFCCNFYGFAADWSHFTLRYETLDLRNALELDILLDARVLKWINLENISSINLVLKHGNSAGAPHLRAHSSSLAVIPSFRTIYLEQCRVGEIDNEFKVGPLTIENSTVNGLLNLQVENPPDRFGFKSFNPLRITDCIVGYIYGVTVFGNAWVQNSNVHVIHSSSVLSTVIAKTKIDIINPSGLSCKVGPCRLESLTIRHMHRNAMHVTGTLQISNVLIEKCEEPCFLLKDSKVSINNFTVNDRIVSSVDDAVFNAAYVSKTMQVDELSMDRGICRLEQYEEKSKVFCDLPHGAKLDLVLQTKKASSDLMIFHHRDIAIYAGLYNPTFFVNVTGDFYDPTDEKSWFRDTHVPHPHLLFPCRLILDNSTFGTLYAPCAYALMNVFTEGRSYVGYLDVCTVSHFVVSSMDVKYLENLSFKKQFDIQLFNFTNGTIEVVQNLVLQNAGVIQDCRIGRIEHLKIMHQRGNRNRTTIKNCVIGEVLHEGILVDEGVLELSNVKFEKLTAGMIRLGPRAKLLIGDYRRENLWDERWCEKHGPVVNAVMHTQVVLLDLPKQPWLLKCVKIRPSLEQGKHILPGHRALDPERDCTRQGQQDIFCDMTGKKHFVLGDTDALDHYEKVTVKHGTNFTIAEHCLNKITVDDGIGINMTTSKDSCFTTLNARNSVFNEVEGNFLVIEAYSSVIKRLNPSSVVQKISIEHSLLEKVDIEGLKIEFINTTIKEIGHIRATEHLRFINCRLSSVEKKSIVIPDSGILVFKNTTIYSIESEAIKVDGCLGIDGLNIVRGSDLAIQHGKHFATKRMSFSERLYFNLFNNNTMTPLRWEKYSDEGKWYYRDSIGFVSLKNMQRKKEWREMDHWFWHNILPSLAVVVVAVVAAAIIYKLCRRWRERRASNSEVIEMATLRNGTHGNVEGPSQGVPGVNGTTNSAAVDDDAAAAATATTATASTTAAAAATPSSTRQSNGFNTQNSSPVEDCFQTPKTSLFKDCIPKSIRNFFRSLRDRFFKIKTAEISGNLMTNSSSQRYGTFHDDTQGLVSDETTLNESQDRIFPGWQGYTADMDSNEVLPMRQIRQKGPEPSSPNNGPHLVDGSWSRPEVGSQGNYGEVPPPPLPPRQPITPRLRIQQGNDQGSQTTRHTGGPVLTQAREGSQSPLESTARHSPPPPPLPPRTFTTPSMRNQQDEEVSPTSRHTMQTGCTAVSQGTGVFTSPVTWAGGVHVHQIPQNSVNFPARSTSASCTHSSDYSPSPPPLFHGPSPSNVPVTTINLSPPLQSSQAQSSGRQNEAETISNTSSPSPSSQVQGVRTFVADRRQNLSERTSNINSPHPSSRARSGARRNLSGRTSNIYSPPPSSRTRSVASRNVSGRTANIYSPPPSSQARSVASQNVSGRTSNIYSPPPFSQARSGASPNVSEAQSIDRNDVGRNAGRFRRGQS